MPNPTTPVKPLMPTVAQIIELHGGLEFLVDHYIRIENPPYMRLVIEYIGNSLRGVPQITVAHYGEQNGDSMRDPEMIFEIGATGQWVPIYFRNDYVGVEQFALRELDGRVVCNMRLVRELTEFAPDWDTNLGDQGFIEAYRNLAHPIPSGEPPADQPAPGWQD